MAAAHRYGGLRIGRKMHIQPFFRTQALPVDGRSVFFARSMKERLRRRQFLQLDIDGDGMSLVGADATPVRIEGVALLGIGPHDFLEHLHCERTLCGDAGNELLRIRPAVFIQSNACRFRLVP